MNLFEDIEKTAVVIRDAIRDIPTKHKENFDMVNQLDKETQDLLHLMEFYDLNASEGFKAYKELQRIRRTRRNLKKENELLEPIANTLKKFKSNLTELDKVIGDIRKVQNSHKARTYKAKVRTDLQEKFDKVGSV